MTDAKAQHEVVTQLKRSAKYGRVCEDTLRRTASWALARATCPADAVKRAKRKLHQVCGAFCSRRDLAQAEALINTLTDRTDDATLREVCARAMGLQESTRERLDVLASLFGRVFQITGRLASLCDVGCGLNPLAAPWMDLPGQVRYVALDIDCGLVAAVSEFFRRRGLCGEARCQDVLVEPPAEPFDVVLLMKLLPSLDQQRPGSGLGLLRSMQFGHAVVSYPTRSLGGRDVGMESFYGRSMRGFLGAMGWPFTSFVLGKELFFVVHRAP
ncbi:MAG: hypothetical protein MUP47_09630 [Phycisphaerae bacterium]|nr:hypothetical protein [Phycisphaerae bacterium]